MLKNQRITSECRTWVTCRMAGGGARTPLALTDVRVGFLNEDGDFFFEPIYAVAEGAELSAFGAKIKYNGAGRLTGRWKVVRNSTHRIRFTERGDPTRRTILPHFS
jgi:hypothetical protein